MAPKPTSALGCFVEVGNEKEPPPVGRIISKPIATPEVVATSLNRTTTCWALMSVTEQSSELLITATTWPLS